MRFPALSSARAAFPARAFVCLFAALLASFSLRADSPRLWLWAWDRPEDLRFLKPEEAGVAFFVLGLRITGEGLACTPRTAPLRLSKGMHRLAVVRIEMLPDEVEDKRLGEVLDAIHRYALVPGIEALQMDFDARRSQRPFYRRLLARLSRDMPPRTALAMTALASWCMGDPWIRELPVKEATLMLFRMGRGAPGAAAWLRGGHSLARPAGAALAWGFSTDEAQFHRPPAQARVYCFNPHPWTRAAFRQAQHLAEP